MNRRYSAAYPGESPDKAAARLFLYRLALSSARAGHAVVLAGTEPEAEIALLRDYLRWPAERAWIVDWARRTETRRATLDALARSRKLWPEANVRHDDVAVVLGAVGPVGFANLDFMGFMDRGNMQPCVSLAIRRLVQGGVLGLTWFRGRETDAPRRSAWDVLSRARATSRAPTIAGGPACAGWLTSGRRRRAPGCGSRAR